MPTKNPFVYLNKRKQIINNQPFKTTSKSI